MTAFAIMRSREGIRPRAGWLARFALALWWSASAHPGAACPGPPAAAPDSVGAAPRTPGWQPPPVEEVEAPERLDLAPTDSATAIAVRATLRDGRVALARVDSERGGRNTRIALSTLGYGGGPAMTTASVSWQREGIAIAGGALSAQGAGVLYGAELGLSRRASRPQGPRVGLPGIGAPAGLTSASVDGFAACHERRGAGRGPGGSWLLAGRRHDDGVLLGAAGVAARVGRCVTAVAVGVADPGERPGAASIGSALARMGLRSSVLAASAAAPVGSGSVAAEWLSASRGVGLLLGVGAGPAPVRLSARWRYESWSARPVSAELVAETGSRAARARLVLATGPTVSVAADLAAEGAPAGFGELEGAWSKGGRTVLARVGRTGEQRFAAIDATVARGGGRTFALLATRRARRDPGGSRQVGASLGGRLDLLRRGSGELELVVEAVRVDPAGGFSAWSRGLHASGATTLRSLTRPGLASSARGRITIGRLALGGVVSSVQEGAGGPTTTATIWIERRAARGR